MTYSTQDCCSFHLPPNILHISLSSSSLHLSSTPSDYPILIFLLLPSSSLPSCSFSSSCANTLPNLLHRVWSWLWTFDYVCHRVGEHKRCHSIPQSAWTCWLLDGRKKEGRGTLIRWEEDEEVVVIRGAEDACSSWTSLSSQSTLLSALIWYEMFKCLVISIGSSALSYDWIEELENIISF